MVVRLVGGKEGGGGEKVSWDAFKNENPHPVGGGNKTYYNIISYDTARYHIISQGVA